MGISAEADGWGAQLTRSIAEEVKRCRKARSWSAQKLSDECAALGYDFPRSTLADLENGRRSHISVAELLVLARALDIPPVLLVFPVGHQSEAEVFPGEKRPVFRAALWFTGEAPSPSRATAEGEIIVEPEPDGPARALALYRAHDQAFREEMDAIIRAQRVDEQLTEHLTEEQRNGLALAAQLMREGAEQCREAGERIRQEAAAEGLIPPARIAGLLVGDTKEPEDGQ